MKLLSRQMTNHAQPGIMKPHISKTEDELSLIAAESITALIEKVLKEQDRFTIALSGGNTPRKLYQQLATPAFFNRIPWHQLHFFWGDERVVPYEDERNNARMAQEQLLQHVPVIKEQVHMIRTDLDPHQSAQEYENILRDYFGESIHSFDLVLLGLGDDGHTLSLFPGYENIHEKEKWVMAYFLAEQNMFRITLTTPIVNRALNTFFLVAGGSKAVPLQHVMYGIHDPDLYPAQLIQPYTGRCEWYVDQQAARELGEGDER